MIVSFMVARSICRHHSETGFCIRFASGTGAAQITIKLNQLMTVMPAPLGMGSGEGACSPSRRRPSPVWVLYAARKFVKNQR